MSINDIISNIGDFVITPEMIIVTMICGVIAGFMSMAVINFICKWR